MRVPVPGARLPVEGTSGAFLYKRREDHFHQGFDIGALYDPETATVKEHEHDRMRKAGELPILSILDGEVVEVRPNDVGSYGRIVVIESNSSVLGEAKTFWHLYSHCSVVLCKAGDTVLAGQTIALVGWSGNAKRSNPHLHFELATKKLPTTAGPAGETTPSKAGIRIDPREVLARLPPFGMRVFTPKAAEPTEVLETHITTLHNAVEDSGTGGYFPLGANNTWHGGVHLPFADNENLYCPLDGQIVAARLDPDPATSSRQHGGTNFILVRHELPLRVYHQLRGTTPAPSSPPGGGGGGQPSKKSGVGGNYDNDPDLLEQARAALISRGHDPGEKDPKLEMGSVEPQMIEAVKAFQATLDPPKSYKPWPDGSMRYRGFTWDALFADAPHEGPAHPDDDTDPDPPGEPADEDDSLPARPPPPPQDPKRVVWSLFMHLAAEAFSDPLAKRFPWLQAAHLHDAPKDPPPGIEQDLELARKHREDLAEAAAHRIRKHVGKGDENPDDVKWVRKRLHRLDALPEDDSSGEYDEALREAVFDFQEQHVYRKKPEKADGVITRGRRTDIFLRKSRRQLGLDPTGTPVTIDPLVRALLSERGVDGMTRVLSGLSVPVSAGEPLWGPGESGGFADDGGIHLARRVHWEMFSEHEVFVAGQDGWASVVDLNEDLTADAPRALMDLVADWPTGTVLEDLPPDGIIDPAELAAFYGDAASDFLRRRQCQFRSEWGLDIEATVVRLKDQGWAGADGLRGSLLPYQWWFDALDVLPSGTHVWHYNPIEFLGVLRDALVALAPDPPKSREQYGSVRIRVVNNVGGPAVGVQVRLVDSESTVHEEQTDKPARNGLGGGVVDFPNVREGACTIVLSKDGEAHPIEHESVSPGWDANLFVVVTAFEGPEPARGGIRATVRRFGSIHKPPVQVQLVDATGRVAASQTSTNAKLHFDSVPLGEYTLRSVDGESEPTTVSLDRIRTAQVVVRRKPEPADLMVTVLHGGSVAAKVEVRVTDAKSAELVPGGLGQTDDEGRCILSLRRGRHHVRVGRKKKHINLVAGANEVLVEVDGALTPDEPYSVLHIKVTAPTTDAKVPVSVFRSGEPHSPLHERYLDSSGELVLRVPSGEYRVVYGSRETQGTAHGGTYNTVDL